MANIISNWVLVEDSLSHLYGFLMGTYQEATPGYGAPTHPVARQVFSVVESLNARLELVNELCGWRAKDEAPTFAELRTSIRRVGAGRHLVAHGHWHLCERYPNDLVLFPFYGLPVRYTAKDFEEISARILAVNEKLGQLVHRIFLKGSKHA